MLRAVDRLRTSELQPECLKLSNGEFPVLPIALLVTSSLDSRINRLPATEVVFQVVVEGTEVRLKRISANFSAGSAPNHPHQFLLI